MTDTDEEPPTTCDWCGEWFEPDVLALVRLDDDVEGLVCAECLAGLHLEPFVE